MPATIEWRLDEDEQFRRATDAIIQHARDIAPQIRERSSAAESLRRLPDETMEEAKPLFSTLVPKRWGGQGLGSRAICEIARELAHGDASSAWALSFLIEHSFMACHLSWEAQEELFAERPYILASAPLAPGGTAIRVDGGFEVTGTFRYASGIGNSDLTFATALLEEDGEQVPYTFLIPLSDLTVNDDWYMAGMAATSSSSVTGTDVFVPERRGIKTEIFDSVDLHPGAVHEESFLRYPPLGTIRIMMAAVSLGSAEACVGIARERLPSTKTFNLVRLDSPVSRVRWGEALQKVRTARLLYRDMVERMIVKCDAVESWGEEETGKAELDLVMIVNLSREAVHLVCDGLGSSIYKLEDPLQRYRRDVDVMASHLFQERDVVADRAVRVLLGLGYLPTDPFPTRPPRVTARD